MRGNCSVELLRRVRDATPEKLAAIERILDGEAFPDGQQSPPPTQQPASSQLPRRAGAFKAAIEGDPTSGSFSIRVAPANGTSQPAPPTVETPDPSRYSLGREAGCWVLLFKGKYAYLKHEIGLHYVNYLLHHPNEAVSGATLFSKFHPQSPETSGITQLVHPDDGERTDLPDDATPSEENLDKDTQTILAAHREKAQEFRETLRDPEALPSEKEFARQQLQQIIGFLATEKSTTQDPNTCAAKRVRKSIQRLCDNLASQKPGQPAPDPLAREFAGYIAQHILVPSRRYTVPKKGANVRVARGELAGQLTFECPPGHCWSVRP